jgi:hypothetical protein
MNAEELLVTLEMLDYELSSIKWKDETCVYFETQDLTDAKNIIKDMNLIASKYKNIHYIFDKILDTYCIVVYKYIKDASWF